MSVFAAGPGLWILALAWCCKETYSYTHLDYTLRLALGRVRWGIIWGLVKILKMAKK